MGNNLLLQEQTLSRTDLHGEEKLQKKNNTVASMKEYPFVLILFIRSILAAADLLPSKL